MPKRSSKSHPHDPNQLGKLIVALSVGEVEDEKPTDRFTYELGDLELYDKGGNRIHLPPSGPPDADTGKDAAAVALGRKGGLKGDMENKHQRKGVPNNAYAGREFEAAALLFWESEGIVLKPNFSIPIGYSEKKQHRFDLGSADPPILVECKSYTWTETGGSPSAKIRGINEAMLLFSLVPDYRKILFLLKHMHTHRKISLAAHYIHTQGHLIASRVEIWEFDLPAKTGERLR